MMAAPDVSSLHIPDAAFAALFRYAQHPSESATAALIEIGQAFVTAGWTVPDLELAREDSEGS